MFDDSAARAALDARLRSIFAPPDNSDIVTWLEKHQTEIPYSPLRGPWRVAAGPWTRAPLEAIADPEVRQVSILAAVQMAKSQLLELALNHIIAREPGPTLALQDQNPNAKDWAITRLEPLWKHFAPVADLLPPEDKRTKLDITFPTMQLWIRGARNIRNLQRRSCKTVIGDEVWLWPKGHLAEAKARLTAFKQLSKAVFAAQGGWEGDDWHGEWIESSQDEWGFHCPKCGHAQKFDRNQLEFRGAQRADGEWDLSRLATETHLVCANESCRHVMADTEDQRHQLNASGIYLRTNHDHRTGHLGFRWNKIAGHSWAGIAQGIILARRAADSGDDNPRRQIAQKVFAEFWSDGATAEDVMIAPPGGYKEGEDWDEEASIVAGRVLSPAEVAEGVLPNGRPVPPAMLAGRVPFRCMTIDVQRGSFFFVIRSWSQDGRSRLRAHGEVRTWAQLDKLVAHHGIHFSLVSVDCGDADDDFWVEMKRRTWRAMRGDKRDEFTVPVMRRGPDGKPVRKYVTRPFSENRTFGSSANFAVPVIYWSNLAFKDRLSRQRRLGQNTVPDDIDADYQAQMESEAKVKDPKTGRRIWKQRGARANHLWDCEAMQYLMPFALGVFVHELRRLGPVEAQPDEEKPDDEKAED